jgi:MFS family permease
MSEKCETGVLRGAWYVTLVFFVFVVLHYADKFLISPLLPLVRDEFRLGYTKLGAIETGTILIAVASMPMARPCVSSSVQDVALSEVRGSAMAMLLFFYNVGSAFAPLITGYAADRMGLEWGIVTMVNITWSVCIILLSMAAVFIPRDIEWKRRELAERAKTLASKQEGL